MYILFLLLSACGTPSDGSQATPGLISAEQPTATAGNTEWYPDADSDGFGDATAEAIIASEIDDGETSFVHDHTDCDDTSNRVFPGATESCNNTDDNCDGFTDNAGADVPFWYLDMDGDGFGDAAVVISSCDGPSRFVNDATDCDDVSVDVNPNAPESCNSTDDDCDGEIDEDPSIGPDWFFDRDGDGAGGADEEAVIACERPGLDYIPGNSDCDDSDAEIHSGADELCDGVDNDCDGDVDDRPVIGEGDIYYPDFDLDGYGSSMFGGPTRACSDPMDGSVLGDTDCADYDSAINPGATESCNNMDDNCDGSVDEGISESDMFLVYEDMDGDGFGTDAVSFYVCDSWGYTTVGGDCDDARVTVPGHDPDRDGYDLCEGECDDYDRSVHPDAEEFVGNLVDDDCDGATDETTAE